MRETSVLLHTPTNAIMALTFETKKTTFYTATVHRADLQTVCKLNILTSLYYIVLIRQ